MKKKILIIAGAVILGVALSFAWYQRADAPVHGEEFAVLIAPDGKTERIVVEIADDDAERGRGLMERDSLPAGTGMLFVYDSAFELGFWMKNTRIPLDILFFDSEETFVSRTTMDPCIADPCKTYYSSKPARYVLEVNRGEPLAAQAGTGWTLRREVK